MPLAVRISSYGCTLKAGVALGSSNSYALIINLYTRVSSFEVLFNRRFYRIFKILNTNLRKTYFLAVSPIKQGFKHAESILLRGFLHVRNSFVFRL